MKTCLLIILLLGLLAGSSLSASTSCSCPQCIVNRPVCATDSKRHRRSFLSECQMRCYNKCYGTDYTKLFYGLNCV